MENKNDYQMVISTCTDKENAGIIARTLVEKRLAACVQMLPIESVYSWKGKICEENEIIIFIKSKTDLFAGIMGIIKELHSHEVPEIIQVPISGGLLEYLQWIDSATVEPKAE